MSTRADDRHYTDEEARTIFERALELDGQARSEGLRHDELLEAAREVGLSDETVEQAVQEMMLDRAARRARATIIERRRRRFKNHLIPFLIVNAFLLLLNWFISPGIWWALFPLWGWGMALIFHAWFEFSKHVRPKALQREMLRQGDPAVRLALQGDREAQRRRRAWSIEHSTKVLEETVEEGIATVLEKITHEVQRHQRPRRHASTATPKTRVATPRARVSDEVKDARGDVGDEAEEPSSTNGEWRARSPHRHHR